MTTEPTYTTRAPLVAMAARKRIAADRKEADALELRRQADALEAEALRREEAAS